MSRTKGIAVVAVTAAMYVILTVALAPISYGVVQFRLAELVKPLALFHPVFCLAFGLGTFLSNLFSPFGPWDWAAMPVVDMVAGYVCWLLRRRVNLALLVQALIISAGVALFPLGFGGRLPFWPSFASVLVSQVILLVAGYHIVWRALRGQIEDFCAR